MDSGKIRVKLPLHKYLRQHHEVRLLGEQA